MKRVYTMHMEKRDMEAVIRFLDNLRDNGVVNSQGVLEKAMFVYWREAQKIEVTTEDLL